MAIEEALIAQRGGGRLPPNFKTFDKYKEGVATSIKSLDTTAPSYAKPGAIESRLRGYINGAADFPGYTRGGMTLRSEDITKVELLVAGQVR